MVILKTTNVEEIKVVSPIPKGVQAEITINGEKAYAYYFSYEYPNCADKIVSVDATTKDTLTTFSTLVFSANQIAPPQTVNIADSNGSPFQQVCNFNTINYKPINYNLTHNLTIVIVNLNILGDHTTNGIYYTYTTEASFIAYGTLLGYSEK